MFRALALVASLVASHAARAADDAARVDADEPVAEDVANAPANLARAEAALRETHAYSLDEGTLLDAVAAISRTSGIRIVFAPGTRELERHRLSAPLAGELTTRAALDALVRGSNLRWRVDAFGTVQLERTDGTAEVELPTLTIEDSKLNVPQDRGVTVKAPDLDIDAQTAAATVLQGPLLEAQVIQRIDDLLRRAPNVSGRGSSLSIRGIERGDETAITASVYLDGIPIGGRALDFGLFGLDRLARVEYQRGPRSLWEGVGALAGTIRLETTDPTPERRATVGAEADDSGDLNRVRAAVNGELMPGLSARATFERREQPGFIDNVYREEESIDRSTERSSSVKFLYEPDSLEALTLRLSAFHSRGDPGQPRIVPPRDDEAFDPRDRLTYDLTELETNVAIDGARLEGEWRFGEKTTATMSATWSATSEESARSPDLDGTFRAVQDDDESRREIDLQLRHAFTPAWAVIAGLTHGERAIAVEDGTEQSVANFYPSGVTVTPESVRLRTRLVDTLVKTDSALVELERRGKHWDFALGFRHLVDNKRQRLRTRDRLTEPGCTIRLGSILLDCADEYPEVDDILDKSEEEPVNVPRFLMRYRPNDEHTFALTYREGYLGGGARLNVFTGDFREFQAERSESLDFAYETTALDGIDIKATFFYNRWRDRQVPFQQPPSEGSIIVNAARARAWGGELELRGDLPWDLSWWLGVGGLRTRYDRFPLELSGNPGDLAGNRFPGAPEQTATAGIAWRGQRGWYAALNGWYSGDAYSDARNSELGLRDAHEVFDLKGGRRFGDWHVYGYVTNLLDESYVEDVRLGELTPSARDYLVGLPRQFGVGIEYTF